MLLPKIETGRLILRTYKQEELEAVYRLCSDPDVTRFFSAEYKINRENVLASLPRRRERWRKQGFGQLGVFTKSEELIGFCGLQYLDASTDVEIYYGFYKEYWGRGIACESATAVLRFAFEELKQNKIVAVCHPENFASHKVLLNLGFSKGEDANFYNTPAAFFSLHKEDFKIEDDFFVLTYEESDE